ncbi:aBC superfamily ATP binding cassette transporter permease/ABC protein [Firmicutes bacterium CAG:321]|nr:aBC superfamily ATP binding cassette transporter permease/ABC protein [Firmicutes bacterium CAG:321]
MSSNEKERNSHSRGHGPMIVSEKPKDFMGSIKKLMKSLSSFKVLIFIALVLAALSSILSLIAPNKLSDLTDEITKGITINTSNMKELEEDLTKNISDIGNILGINLDEKMIYRVNSSGISSEDKIKFNDTLKSISSNQELILKYFSELPDSVLDIIIGDSTYNDIYISKEDKITTIRAFSDIDVDNKKFNGISSFPDSMKKALFPDTVIDGIEISTDDKVEFITLMAGSDSSSVNEMYKVMENLPINVQKVIGPKMDMDKIKSIAILLACLYIISAIFSYIEGLSMIKVANGYAKKLRSSISEKINKLPLKFFDHNLSGDILSRVTNDVDTIAQSLNNSLSTLVSSITLFIGSIIMMFATNYIMAITAIVSSLIGFILMFIILNKSQRYFTARQRELGKLNGYIEEIYSGLNVVRSCNAKDETINEFDKLNDKLYDCNRKSQFLSGLMQPIMGFIGNFSYVAVCIVGALLVSKSVISFGVIVAFMMYVRLFTNPLSQIAQAMTSMQSTAAASERVFGLLEEVEMDSENDITKKLDKHKVKGNIEFKNVKFGYDKDKIIINDFTAKVKAGEKIAIVGPTGAGKTTMVNLLMKFYDINDGDILIDGTSIKELKRDNIHSLFTMVLQDTWLFNGTVKENIIYNQKNVSNKKVEEVCKVVGVDHFIKTLPNGYDSIISDNDSVSSGQRQLLTIARGMISDSPFLILDEATSNVDTRTEELVQKAMDKLMENKTSFIIAHRLSTIKNADLILVMKDGNIIEQGNHNELMKKNGFYANLYNSQFEKTNS